jgi:single-stranded DNA-binding protein
MPNVLDIKITDDLIESLSRNRCVNRVHIIGKVATRPVLSAMSRSLKRSAFSVVMAESWTQRSTGERRHHLNIVDIEVLGQDAERASRARPGSWIAIDGYLRTEGQGGNRRTLVRTYSIQSWEENVEPDRKGERGLACGSEGLSQSSGPGGVEVVGKKKRRPSREDREVSKKGNGLGQPG